MKPTAADAPVLSPLVWRNTAWPLAVAVPVLQSVAEVGRHQVRSQLLRAVAGGKQVPTTSLADYMQPGHIDVETVSGTTKAFAPTLAQAWPQLLEQAKHGAGYVRLRGKNGVGKSTALLALKQELSGLEVALLPARPGDLYVRTVIGSTGEQDMAAAAGLLAGPAKVLLIDEADEHLDAVHRAALHEAWRHTTRAVAEGGQGRFVVEVSHHLLG